MSKKQGPRLARSFREPMKHLYNSHRDIRHFLAVIADVLRQTSGGALMPAQWYDLAASITYFKTAAVTHTADEEESVFPRLRASRNAAPRTTIHRIAELKRDHRVARRRLRALDALIRRWLANGTLEPTDVRHLGKLLSALETVYQHHFAYEDNELFPLAKRVLSARQIREIGHEMVARRTRGAHFQVP